MAVSPDQLAGLVALDTVSPMKEPQLQRCAEWLRPLGVRREGDVLAAGDPGSDVWVYAHVDTKPAGDRARWHSDPWSLQQRGARYYGLGTSDSKAQLLAAIEACDFSRHFLLIDTSEETDHSTAAGDLVRRRHPRWLVVADGAAATPGQHRFSALHGQIDGEIPLTTGLPRTHPGRRARGRDILDELVGMRDWAAAAGMALTITGIEAPHSERSLSLEALSARVDVRYLDEAAGDEFIQRYRPVLRHRLRPLTGARPAPGRLAGLPAARFSSRLAGSAAEPLAEHLVVVAGGRVDNGAHAPNEWIAADQLTSMVADLVSTLQDIEQLEGAEG